MPSQANARPAQAPATQTPATQTPAKRLQVYQQLRAAIEQGSFAHLVPELLGDLGCR